MSREGKRSGQAALAEVRTPDTMQAEASENFVLTPHVRRIADRALAYLQAGYPVHFSGPAGTGKTTLALHVAALRGRTMTLMHGDDARGSSDLIGSDYGFRKSKVVDNFIHSVVRTEEQTTTLWADNRLTQACKTGDTLVYDEFTRSRPEANNGLLSVLEERLLALPMRGPQGDEYLEVHPEFRAIFTSNPEEYAGVHRTQDALMDRLITIKVDYCDRDTEARITQSRSGIPLEEAEVIVDIVRALRGMALTKQSPSLRACIMIARVLAQTRAHAYADEPMFMDVCGDVLSGFAIKTGPGANPVEELVARYARRRGPRTELQAVPTPIPLAAPQEA
ncbi:gas vesicle protein GvpN [Hyalangium gracile]|uniref:gas vesicle protein GvpN n=1 Tax=Hyalangium gracile TaxID=394092 RepID=UPI001CCE0A8C|nr:gas vesicle protein GvpN [Hyalangium gracile]